MISYRGVVSAFIAPRSIIICWDVRTCRSPVRIQSHYPQTAEIVDKGQTAVEEDAHKQFLVEQRGVGQFSSESLDGFEHAHAVRDVEGHEDVAGDVHRTGELRLHREQDYQTDRLDDRVQTEEPETVEVRRQRGLSLTTDQFHAADVLD